MKKITENLEILSQFVPLKGKTVIDVGCGTGELVRDLARHGAEVTGIDSPDMIAKAREYPRAGAETYQSGAADPLPFSDQTADLITYFASFHHVPPERMTRALKEGHRVLRPGGSLVFLEPVGEPGSYFELIRLVEDERNIQAAAFQALQKAENLGLQREQEYRAYFERSTEDFTTLNEIFIADASLRDRLTRQARRITRKLSQKAGVDPADFRYRSICRVNVFHRI